MDFIESNFFSYFAQYLYGKLGILYTQGGMQMVMSRLFTFFLLLSVIASLVLGNGEALASSVLQGAQSGVTLAISLSGSICLWSGVGNLMRHIGITAALAKFMRPVLWKVFPSAKIDRELSEHLSGNISANVIGLGNAATPMGIAAARRLKKISGSDSASDELCRLIVLNTASIQLIPTNVAALRASLGCRSPFDILPAVWFTSILSAGLGLGIAFIFGRICKHG